MDVMDEVAAGGRLTRSLRKRLTSVDSEASTSRPNTPIGTKLNIITEQNSPPRSTTRLTRRNSVSNLASTPAKKTPSKTISSRTIASRLDTTSEINSPMRRVNRRRSISITEDEETTTTSVQSIPKIEAVPEEETSTSKRITRSASKSPLQLITNSKNVENTSPIYIVLGTRPKRTAKAGPGPKSKTKPSQTSPTDQGNNIDSEVEVIDLESEDEENVKLDIKTKQNNGINGDKTEETAKVEKKEKTPRNNSRKTPQKTITENKIAHKVKKSPSKDKQRKSYLTPKFIERLETESETEPELESKNQSIHETEINETTNEIETEKKVATEIGNETPKKTQPSNLEHSPNVFDDRVHDMVAEQLTTPKNNRNGAALVTNVINLKCLSPEIMSEIEGFKKNSPAAKKANIPEKLKAVGFNDSIDDDATKSSYPKTPGSSKMKSYIELDSSREVYKDNSFQALSVSDSIEMEEQKTLQKDTIREEQADGTHTPIKSIAKLKTIKSSTPLLNDTTISAAEAVANTVSNVEELVHLNEVEYSQLKSPKKSFTSRQKSLVESPSSTSLPKSPINRKKSISVIDEMEVVPLDTTQQSESEQKLPEKLTASPYKPSVKISENLRSPQKCLTSPEETSINKRESLEAALQKKHTIEMEETKSDSSESKQMPKKSPCSFERAKQKSLDASFQSPRKMVLRNSPQHMQSPNTSTSIKSPEKLKSPKKSLSPKKAAKLAENTSPEAKQSDEPSSIHAVAELVEASPKAAALVFTSAWTHNVSGVSNNNKIDQIIEKKEITPNKEPKYVNEDQQESATRHRSRFESDDDDENIGFDEEEADEELAENEKPNKAHAFILDEAMEVDDDYQSGDSMDSEERRELEINEIICDGESIGSEDTTDGNEAADEDNEDDDGENDSFIADDSNEESLLDYSDNDDETEHLLEVERKNKKNLKKKPYRRILTVDDESDASKNENDGDDDESNATKNENDGDDKNNSSEEDIGTLIESISKIVNEDGNSEGDDGGDEVVEKNVDRSKAFELKPDAESDALKSAREESQKTNRNDNINVNLKEKRRFLNRAKATEEPREEQVTNQKRNLHKMQTHDKHKDNIEDHEDGDQEEDEDQEYEDHATKNHDYKDLEDKEHEDEEYEDGDHLDKRHEDDNKNPAVQDQENEDDEDGDDEGNNNPNSSKLSETAIRLRVFDTDEENSDDPENNVEKETSSQAHLLNTSRMKIMKHLQQSERFNKTVHDFRMEKPEEESGSTEAEEKIDTTNVVSKNIRRAASLGSSKIMEQRRSHRLSSNQHHRSKEMEAAVAACETSSNSSEDECHQSTEKQMYKTLQRYSLGRNPGKVNKQDADPSNKTETDIAKSLSSIKSSQIQEQINRDAKELIAINGDADTDTDSEANIDEKQYHFEKSTNKKNHSKSSSALSVSLGYIKECRDERIPLKNAHSSFTIGVVVRNKCKNRGATPDPIATPESSLNGDDEDDRKGGAEASSSDTETEAAMFSSAEEEQLEKLEHIKQLPLAAGLNSSAVYTKQTTEAITDFKNSSKQRRTICIPADYGDFTTSQSFIESVAAESRGEFVTSQASTKRKRLSKSFCAGASLDTTDLEEAHHLNKKSKLARNDIAINSSTPQAEEKKNIEEKKTEQKNIDEEKAKQKNIDEKTSTEQKETNSKNDDIKQRVLSRCEEILEAANCAKLEAKLNSNKSKVKLLKKKKSKKIAKVLQQQQQLELKRKDENETKDNEEVKITQKQLKRQERAKLEIEKALKASANLILHKTEKKIIQNMATQQLPKTVLDRLCNTEPTCSKVNKSKDFLPSKMDTKILKTSAGEVLEIRLVEKKKKKISPPEEIQLSTGTVRVEPATPTKQLIRSGFRESPMTPLSLGFKVRHILSAGQDTPPVVPAKERKRKRNVIEEPRHTLPKPQWTQSGIFIEEEIYASAPITTSGSTKFIVSALNGVRKKKKKLAKAGTAAQARQLVSSSVNSSALQFKKNALFRDGILRETSHELIQRKQRKNI